MLPFIPLTLHADAVCAEFVTPGAVRSAIRREKGSKYGHRKDAEQENSKRKELRKRGEDDLAVGRVFA